MTLPCTSIENFDIISLEGEVKIGTLPSITSQLSRHMEQHDGQNLVLDLSAATFLDSSALRLLVNLRKKLDSEEHEFLLLSPSTEVGKILEETNLHKAFTILETGEKLRKRVSDDMIRRYAPYTSDEAGWKRLRCKCPVCGGTDIVGYLIDPSDFEWEWQPEDYFPSSFSADGHDPVDVLGQQPIVCRECFFSTIEIGHVTVCDENGGAALKSNLSDETRNLLSKAIKKRKGMMEIDIAVGDNFFLNPRDPVACYQAYTLADSCIRGISINKEASDPFTIGYLNYMALKYAQPGQKDGLIANCRTWLTQAVSREGINDHLVLSKSYFILLVVDLSLNKMKEASQLHAKHTELAESLPHASGSAGINSPLFWYRQAHAVWEAQIRNESRQFTADT